MNWTEVVERTVAGMGYDLVETERSAGGLLRVYIDRLPGRHYDTGAGEFITVDDCEKVTRQLQHVLEVEECAYERLEVSSPGLDRPLHRESDYERFVGEQVAITLKLPFQGRKKFQGMLQRVPEAARAEAGSQGVGAGAGAALRADAAAAEAGVEVAGAVQPSVWRLVLDVEPKGKKGGPGKSGPQKTGQGNAGQGTAAAGAAAGTASSVAGKGQAAEAPQQALDFSLNEVREARLVPVLDFKGRRFVPQQHEQGPDADAQDEPQAGEQEDGGRDK